MNYIKMDKENNKTDYELPEELDVLLDGIVVGEEQEMKEYKALRDEMYQSRNVTFSAHTFGRKK